ncbi:DUF3631 domain-containing protein [Streptomyces sp. NPDC093801]|uniref:DUF3631 domain-containing protein n=1 Tax=Streptomyces sp. NPDC093801 TaxID=3155203 RepID=UPI00344C4FC0
MTTHPNLLDAFAHTLLGTAPKPENPHHRALLEAHTTVQHLEGRLLERFSRPLPENTSLHTYVEEYTELVLDRLAAGVELSLLLSAPCAPVTGSTSPAATGAPEADTDCCRPSGDVPAEPDCLSCGQGPENGSCRQAGEEPADLLKACLAVFGALGDPEALASADLVGGLRLLPGTAVGCWSYADLTQTRLAQFLAPYGIQTRDITLPDGRRRKSYRRSAFVSAAWGEDLC